MSRRSINLDDSAEAKPTRRRRVELSNGRFFPYHDHSNHEVEVHVTDESLSAEEVAAMVSDAINADLQRRTMTPEELNFKAGERRIIRRKRKFT